MQTPTTAKKAIPPPRYNQGIFFLGGRGGATTSFFSSAGAVNSGTMHWGLQHFTCLPAAFGDMNPFVSHMGHVTSIVLPGPCCRLTGMAFAATVGSIPNGSSSGAAGGASSADFPARGADGPDLVAAAEPEPLFDAAGLSEPAFAAGALAAGAGRAGAAPPFRGAPQNGQSTASSSSTDCLHAGHVGRSMLPKALKSRNDGHFQNTAGEGKLPERVRGRKWRIED